MASDRALTGPERTAVGKLSSHIEVGSTGASVEYHWGDFKHDPLEVLARYFDVFLYYSDWGSRTLAFRLPQSALDAEQLQPYLWHACVEVENGR